MNLLIIGGLFVLAVVAIVGAVLLSRGDDANSTTGKNTTAMEPSAQANLLARGAPARADASSTAAPGVQAAYTVSEPAAGTSYTPATADGLVQPLLNGQFHELAGEIRVLHQQAWQLEQRLGVLTDMVNQVERTQGGYNSEDEMTRRFPSDSTTS